MRDNTEEKLKQWLGEDNQIGMDIWEKKYRYNNESFDEWVDRVSGDDEDVKELILSKKFLFAGRILSIRGTYKDGRKVTYSNCYVIPPPEDSLESIIDCAKSLARTFSYGGGVGILHKMKLYLWITLKTLKNFGEINLKMIYLS